MLRRQLLKEVPGDVGIGLYDGRRPQVALLLLVAMPPPSGFLLILATTEKNTFEGKHRRGSLAGLCWPRM